MSEAGLQAVRAAFFVGALLVALALERIAPHGRLRPSWRVNGGLWLLDAVIVGAACGACAFTTAGWAARHDVGVLHWLRAGPVASSAGSLVVLDLVSYGWHRANHRVPVLWRFHQVHHSDPTFTTSTGLRFHPGELLLSLPVRLAAVVALGASAAGVLAFEAVFAVANLVEHGDIDVPGVVERALGRVVITPALHRRHHTRCGPERDSNFGTIFSLWDRLGGTYTASDSGRRVDTGLPGLDALGLSAALALPLRRPAAPAREGTC